MEFLVAVGIVAILVAVVFRVGGAAIAKSEATRCASNLRSLHTSLSSYIQDKGHWPQEPEALWEANDNDRLEDWWMKELEPYGATEAVWQCRTILRTVTNRNKDRRPRMHYSPTKFDANPMTPYKWSTQPWLIEIGNMHGVGALICFPDGSVRNMNDVLGGR